MVVTHVENRKEEQVEGPKALHRAKGDEVNTKAPSSSTLILETPYEPWDPIPIHNSLPDEKLFENTQRDLPRYANIRNYLYVGKIYSLWSKRRKDWCFKFKLKGQRALSPSRIWIPLAWRIAHILTKWVSFIGSSTGHVRSSPPSGQGTWSPSRFIFSIVVSFLVYIFTTMCCTWLVFSWSITLF